MFYRNSLTNHNPSLYKSSLGIYYKVVDFKHELGYYD